MSRNNSAIIGSIIERKASARPIAPQVATSSKTGFPTVDHRSKSTFGRNREAARKAGPSQLREPPVVATSPRPSSAVRPVDPDEWREQISRENEERVAGMSEEQREAERREIVERFGAGISGVLKRARETRQRQKTTDKQVPLNIRNIGKDGGRAIENLREGLPFNSMYQAVTNIFAVPISHNESPVGRKSFERGKSYNEILYK